MNSIYSSSLRARSYRLICAAAFAGSLSLLAGCANDSASSSVYTYGQAQREQIVRNGTVESIRPVTIQQGNSGVGMVAGGVLGSVAGSAIGGGGRHWGGGWGGGSALGAVGGALVGGLIGNAIENQTGKTQGLEITVRLDNGETRVVAQGADTYLAPGQRVRMISGNGPTRVVPMQ